MFGNVTPMSKCPFLWAAETRKRKIKYINGRVDDMTILFIGTVNGSLGSGFSSIGSGSYPQGKNWVGIQALRKFLTISKFDNKKDKKKYEKVKHWND